MDAVTAFYVRKAEAIERGPQTYGGSREIAALRCFRAYHKDARIEWRDKHWMTQKQMRVFGILSRLSVTGQSSTLHAIAVEARVCPSTVSRFALKVQAWGEFAIDVRRGKYGGVTVFKVAGDRFAHYARAAREKLRSIAARIRSRFNVASTLMEEGKGANGSITHYSSPMDATLKPRTFAEAVIYERAYLALSDPDGEYEAIHPITREQAIEMLDFKERKPAEVWAIEEERLLQAAMENGNVELVHRINVDRVMRDLAARGLWDKWQAMADFLYPEHVHPIPEIEIG